MNLQAGGFREPSWALQEIFDELKQHGGKWRTYPNPMRSDGVFVAQDKPAKPYPGYTDRFPAVPDEAAALHYQLPHDQAEELVRRLNEASEPKATDSVVDGSKREHGSR